MDPRREAVAIQRCTVRYMGRPKLPPEDVHDPAVEQRFLAHVQKTSTCWWWTGRIGTHGYGEMHVRHFNGDRRSVALAHIVSYLLYNGEIPEGHQIRHTCDNRNCVRPSHLLTGTRKQNMQDAIERNRLRSHNALKTHCPRGHEYSWAYGRRVCRTCRNEASDRWKARHRGPQT